MRAGLAAAGALVLAGCGSAEPAGTPLERGEWRTKIEFATPKIDGLSIDSLRKDLPADSETTECTTPVIPSADGLIEIFSFDKKMCELNGATVAGGTIAAEGECAGLARAMAQEGNADGMIIDSAASTMTISGTYEPQFFRLDANMIMKVTTERGETSRLTVDATRTSERIGDCT